MKSAPVCSPLSTYGWAHVALFRSASIGLGCGAMAVGLADNRDVSRQQSLPDN